jgi:phosphoglycolate phosphatase
MSLSAKVSLLLDLDGTLIHSRPGIMESYHFAARTALPGHRYDPASVVVGPPLPQMFQTTFPKASKSELEKLVGTFREHYAREGLFKTELFESVAELLAGSRQRGIPLYIATNKPLRLATAILDHLNLSSLFRSVLAADSTEPPFAGKAAMLRHLLKEYGLMAEHTLYVGDTGDDASAAGECGLRFVWAAYGYGTLSSEQRRAAFRIVHRLKEMEDLLD